MEMMEIVLLIAGGIIFILSFFIPDKKYVSGQKDGSAESVKSLAEGELKGLISQEMDSIRTHVDDVVEEAVTYAMEKTERSLERLSNEKIMAVSEYSDTVLAEIHKNHEEAMFLYDMLNNKHINLKNTVSEVNRTVKEAEATVMNFQRLTPETFSASEESILNRAAESAARRETGRFVQENSGTGRTGIEKTGTAMNGLERARIERSKKDNFGLDKSGIESAKTDNLGINYSIRETIGIGRTGIEKTGIERTGIEKNGIQKTGIVEKETGKSRIEAAGKEKTGMERLGAPSERMSLGKVSFMQDEDEQGRNNNERILDLFQQGKSTVAIARELGLGVGEVKLVIDLFKNQ